jgi:hypothetical protein
VKPIAVKSASPADGAVAVASQSVAFQVKTDELAQSSRIEVASQPTLGQDGTLAHEFTVDGYINLTRGDAFPDTYTGSSMGWSGSWSTRPGTYYWQMSFTRVDTAPAPVYSEINTYTSPVYTLVIQAPAPPPTTPPIMPPITPPSTGSPPVEDMSVSDARIAIRAAVERKTGRRAYSLKRSCKFIGTARWDFKCKASWVSTERLRGSSVFYAGTFHILDTQDGYFTWRFRGLKARQSCIARRGIKRCVRDVAWG